MGYKHVKGGKKLAAFVRNSKRAAAQKVPIVEAGFLERHVAALAGQLEFGNPATNLPERPAFRGGVSDLKRTLPGVVRDAVSATDWRKGIVVKEAALDTVGRRGARHHQAKL